MTKFIAKTISVLFHPLILPTLGVLILFNSGSYIDFLPFSAKKIILIIVFVSTFILPLTFVPFYLFQNIISTVQMDSHKERLVPFFISFCLYVFCYYLLNRIGSLAIINWMILSGAISVLLLFLVSIKWKISAHMIGLGGLTGTIIALSFLLKVNLQYYLIIAVLISGIVAYSRLTLSAHNPKQIYSGWLVGLISTFVALYFIYPVFQF